MEAVNVRRMLVVNGCLPARVALIFGLCWNFRGDAAVAQAVNTTPALVTPGRTAVATQRATVNFLSIAQQAAMAPAQPAAATAAPETMPVAGDLPVTWSGVSVNAPVTAVAAEPDIPPAVSPSPTASFLALVDNNTSIPPDTHGAAGPNHLMVTLNTEVRIQNRSGGVISTVSLNAFWASVAGGSGTFDPKIIYDAYNNRWIFTACDDSRSASSGILIGVSQTSDPTGSWNLYKIDADGANLAWADYPSIGFNKDWICVQINMYSISANAFQRSHIYVFNKASLYAGGAGSHTLISRSDIGATQVPAITFDNTLSTLYLLMNWNGNSSGNGYVRLFTITGPVGAEVLTLGPLVGTPNPWNSAPSVGNVDFAPQLGSARKIMTNDSRMQMLVYRNGSLWATHTVFLPAGASTRSSIQWWQISTAGTILQRARVDDPSGNVFYAFPSIALNGNADMLLGYARFSATQYASGYYSFRASTDPPNTLQSEVLLKAGEAKYDKDYGSGRNRWGDYSHTMPDPVDDNAFWTIQEYATTPGGGYDRWATWWGKIDPPTPSVTLSLAGSPMPEAGGVATVTATLSSTYGQPVTVNLAFSGTAMLTSDYTRSGTSISIPSGSLSGSVTLTAVQDTLDEADETVVVDIDTVVNGTESGAQQVTAVIADDDVILTVASAFGSPTPPVGVQSYTAGQSLTCTVGSPAAWEDSQSHITAVCTGWTGTGSVPASGNTTNTGPFTITVDSTITWHWLTTDITVSNQTVSGTTNLQARDSITAEKGYMITPTAVVDFRVGPTGTVFLGPEFQAETGSVFNVEILNP